ncbi:MAG: glutamine-hydrolyzing carbamoyl-phosphate synthase small subunit [Planctomycetes bacterium]|nr:glutamine-hydrolyzing carbamoyl-phosphate synthase small subunit [Planctomycetota bacterium]
MAASTGGSAAQEQAGAMLVLQDGTLFPGKAFGSTGTTVGDAVFYTGVVGYQEVLSNPSYRGTIAVLTYPIIGSYGINKEDFESVQAHPRGVVIKEYSAIYSNFRATGALEEYLADNGIVGIRDVDTRAVAVHIREHGAMKALIAHGDRDPKALQAKLQATPSPLETDLVAELAAPDGKVIKGKSGKTVVIIDLGIKSSLLEQIVRSGYSFSIVAASTPAEKVLSLHPDGIVLAGGPGDPRVPAYLIDTIAGLLGKTSLLGIGLGHQVLALALGCGVSRMKNGHYGVNHPVRDLVRERCLITVQHHSYVVEQEELPDGVEITHVNLNDGSVEGLADRKRSTVGIQFHPVPDDRGNPNEIFSTFMNQSSKKPKE